MEFNSGFKGLMVIKGSCSSLFAHHLNFFWLAMIAA